MWPNCAKWRVCRISKEGKCICVGSFHTKEEAKREILRLKGIEPYSYYIL